MQRGRIGRTEFANMAAITIKKKVLVAMAVVMLITMTRLAAAGDDDEEATTMLHHRGRHHRRPHSPPAPAPPAPTPPAAPAPPQQQCGCCDICRPIPCSGFMGAGAAGAGSTAPSFTSCFDSLATMSTCAGFLTGQQATPSRQSACCRGLVAFVEGATAEGGGGDRQLRCLCPVITGDVNNFLPGNPVDPLRLIVLPVACGVLLPPKIISLCANNTSSAAAAANYDGNKA